MPAVAVAAAKPANDTYPTAVRLHRLSVDDYHRMIEIGILTEDDPVELLEGKLVTKMPQKGPHSHTVMECYDMIKDLLSGGEWKVRCQMPITLAHSEPEPDVSVSVGPKSNYFTRHPKANEVALVIEVADSSLLEDRRYKGSLYAAAKIPQLWIVNLPDAVVEVHTSPRAGRSPGYRSVAEFRKGDVVPLVLKGDPVAEIAVADWIR